MFGRFSEESLESYAEAASEKNGEETYDFTRCVRSDGTSYGTGGQCRKGSESAKEEKVKKGPNTERQFQVAAVRKKIIEKLDFHKARIKKMKNEAAREKERKLIERLERNYKRLNDLYMRQRERIAEDVKRSGGAPKLMPDNWKP